MVYGIPEAAMAGIEKQNLDQTFKCIDCALEGLDEEINYLYLVEGTLLCLRHAKESRYGRTPKVDISNPWNVSTD